MKLLIIITIFLSGCGNIKRSISGVTGEPSEYCYNGVRYLQFPSGATVAVDLNGKPLPCEFDNK